VRGWGEIKVLRDRDCVSGLGYSLNFIFKILITFKKFNLLKRLKLNKLKIINLKE
jgi:hypothetical protein